MLPPPTLPWMRTVLSLALPAQSLTPVTCGLALCPGRDSLAFIALPPPPHIASRACRPLPARPCRSWLVAPITSPHPTHPQPVPVLHPNVGICAAPSAAPTTSCGQEISTLAPSSPCDLKQVTASCWASSPLKQRPRGLQKALSRLILKGSPDLLFQRPTKWHLFIYLFT